jgi:hypothetical protein
MNAVGVAAVLVVVALAVIAVWGLATRRKSALAAMGCVVLAMLAAGCAWYAWAESKSTAWSVGYGIVMGISLASAGRQFLRSNRR